MAGFWQGFPDVEMPVRVQSEIPKELHHSQFGGAYAFNRPDFFCNSLVLIWLFGSEGNLERKLICSNRY